MECLIIFGIGARTMYTFLIMVSKPIVVLDCSFLLFTFYYAWLRRIESNITCTISMFFDNTKLVYYSTIS